MALDILTADDLHAMSDSEKKTDQHIPEGFLKPLYSRKISPESNVMGAMNKIDNDFNKDISIQHELQEPSVVFLRRQKSSKDNYKLLQQWEGVVQEIYSDYFVCHLRDLTGDEPDETAEILFEEISESDLSLVSPGAFFYWNIGYYENSSGQRTRSSMIRFRRVPAWSGKEIDAAKKLASELSKKLRWGTSVVNDQIKKTGT